MKKQKKSEKSITFLRTHGNFDTSVNETLHVEVLT